jgi:hypothetical protein
MITGLPVKLILDSIVTAEEVMTDTLYPSESITYVFQSTADLTRWGYHDLAVCVVYPNDPVSENDTILRRYFSWHPGNVSAGQTRVEDISIFPNPAQGLFRMTVDDLAPGEVYIEVYNTLGEQILKQYHLHKAGRFDYVIDLENQPEGLYFIKLLTNNRRFSRSVINLAPVN